jgi:hypothetical protein
MSYHTIEAFVMMALALIGSYWACWLLRNKKPKGRIVASIEPTGDSCGCQHAHRRHE